MSGDHGNETTVFGKFREAESKSSSEPEVMHWYDPMTRETVFERVGTSSNPTTLVCNCGPTPQPLEVPMVWSEGRWLARLRLPDGLHCYGFRAGSRLMRDPEAGSVRTRQGERLSLVVVPGW